MLRNYSLLGLIILILDIIVLIEIFKSPMDPVKKVLWALVILCFPILGLILYYLIGRQ